MVSAAVHAKLLAATRMRRVRTLFTRHNFMPTELAGVYQPRQPRIWQGKDRAADTRRLIPHGSASLSWPGGPCCGEAGLRPVAAG